MRVLKSLGFLVAGAAAAVGVGSPLFAQSVVEDVIVFPIDSRFGGEPGSVNVLTSSPVPAEFQGAECEAEVEALNQESVHPDNDLLITSGGVTVEVDDVESEAFGVTGAVLPITLGTDVEVSLRLGPDGRSSGGLVIAISCPLVAPTTTEAPATTEVPGTTEASTTSVVAALPPGGVASGGQAQSPTLPATGPDTTAWAAIAAIALLAGGSGLVAVARRSR